MNKSNYTTGKSTQSSGRISIYLFLIMILFCNYFNTGSTTVSAIIGTISYFVTFFFIYLLLLRNIGVVKFKTVLLFMFFSLVIMFMIINRGDSFNRVLISLVQLGAIILVTVVSSRLVISDVFLNRYKKLHLVILAILYCFTALRMNEQFYMFRNLNSLAEISALFLIFNIALYYISARKIGIYNIIAYLPLLIISNGRAMQLCVVVFLFVFFGWNIIVKSIFRRVLAYLVVVGTVYVITIEYPGWYYNSSMVDFNHLVRDWTGKNFFSGRQIIWQNIFEIMQGHEWFGFGTGTLYSQLMGENFSAHNQYLQLYMQNGLLGVTSLFIVLFGVWMSLSKHCISEQYAIKQKRISGSLLLAFMIMNIFGVSMLQNAMYSSLTAWFIIGMGLYRSNDVSERSGD